VGSGYGSIHTLIILYLSVSIALVHFVMLWKNTTYWSIYKEYKSISYNSGDWVVQDQVNGISCGLCFCILTRQTEEGQGRGKLFSPMAEKQKTIDPANLFEVPLIH
jgi:hypothetical protein